MVKNHIKRINAPKRWDILRKNKKFISRPNPGRDLNLSVSLNTALKEMLKKTGTTKESKYVIKYKQVLVNQHRRMDEKFPVGFLDVVSMPEIDEHYRLTIDSNEKLSFVKLPQSESDIKISKIKTKRSLKGGVVQINCTDGRNFVLPQKNEIVAKAGIDDTLVYSIKEQKIKDLLKMQPGSLVFLYKGKHTGELVSVVEFKKDNLLFKLGDEVLETKRKYAFVVGKDSKPVVTVKA